MSECPYQKRSGVPKEKNRIRSNTRGKMRWEAFGVSKIRKLRAILGIYCSAVLTK